MKGKEEGSDLWGEFWEKESREPESPLAAKKQGGEETHPAEERNCQISKKCWVGYVCKMLQFGFCLPVVDIFAPFKLPV